MKDLFLWLYLIPAAVCAVIASYEATRLRMSGHRITRAEWKATMLVIFLPLINLLMAVSQIGYAAQQIALKLLDVPVLGEWMRRAELFRN